MNKERALFLDLLHNATLDESGVRMDDLHGIEYVSEFDQPMKVMDTKVVRRGDKNILQIKVEFDVSGPEEIKRPVAKLDLDPPAKEDLSDAVYGVVKVCRHAGVNEVLPSIQHGLCFLLSKGPEKQGCIVFRDYRYSYDQLKELADEVNKALSE